MIGTIYLVLMGLLYAHYFYVCAHEPYVYPLLFRLCCWPLCVPHTPIFILVPPKWTQYYYFNTHNLNPCSRSMMLRYIGQTFNHHICWAQQTTIYKNDSIVTAINNLAQELANLQTINQTTWSTYSRDPILYTFVSMQTFNL